MARTIDRLSAIQAKKLSKPGWYLDGDGLYLQVSPTGSKSWVFRYTSGGRERRQGLGALNTISLAAARKAALECRKLRSKGIDPLENKRELEREERLAKNNGITFKECSLAFIESNKAEWKNRKHETQWRNTLETYAYPTVGDIAVKDIDTDMVLGILEPIWATKTETATRVRQRIENVLDWAKARDFRTGENPARRRGHIDKLLPKPTKIRKVKHLEALPYSKMPAFYQWLRSKESLASIALSFTILTAARNGESRHAAHSEISLPDKKWVLPAERMKGGREHRVPLSSEAMTILGEAKPFSTEEYLFPGQGRKSKVISDQALLKLAKEFEPTLTVHGFRSTFRDWCAEQTNYPREVAEAALAHSTQDQTEAAYQRGDLFEKRARLMEAWARYCCTLRGSRSVAALSDHNLSNEEDDGF